MSNRGKLFKDNSADKIGINPALSELPSGCVTAEAFLRNRSL